MANFSVTTTAQKVVDKNLSRISLFLKNNDTVTIFIGTDNTLTAANGYPLTRENQWVFDFSGSEDAYPLGIYRGEIWAIVSSGTADLRYLELTSVSEFD